MVNSNSFQFGYGVQSDLQDRVQRMTVAGESITASEALCSSKKAYDAGTIVEELVCRYLHCSATTSGIFRF